MTLLLFAAVVLAAIVLFIAAIVVKRNRGPKCDVPYAEFPDLHHWLFGLLKVPLREWPRLGLERSRIVGPLFRIRAIDWLPASEAILVNDIEAIKEMLSSKDFASRDPITDAGPYMVNPEKKGIALQDWTPAWRNLHRFSVSTLNSFGFGKNSMEPKILQEADALVEAMISIDDAFDPMDVMRVAVANVVTKLVFDERNDISQNSPLHDAIFDTGLALFNLSNEPMYRLFPRIVDWYKTPTASRIHKGMQVMRSHVTESVRNHEETLDEADEPRDFIDAFIRERRKHPGEDHLSEENMIAAISDLFQAGTDTTTGLLTWTLAFLLHFPSVGERLRKELSHVIGEDGIPSMTHLPRLHLLRSFMDEVHRMSCIAVFTIPHRCVEEWAKFRGYTITKSQTIMLNLFACHQNPDVWIDAEEFKAERFLDDEGKYQKSNNLIPFGFGNRRCLGERLASIEQFIFTCRLLQRLDFRPASALPDLTGDLFLARLPGRFRVKVTSRS